MIVPKTEIIVTKDGVEIARKTVQPGEYLIGCEADCDLRVEADRVEGAHARLTVNYDEWLIEDLGSSSGTFLNGEPVATEARRVWPSQKITVGGAVLELHALTVEDPGASIMPTTAAIRKHLPPDFRNDRRYQIGGLVA